MLDLAGKRVLVFGLGVNQGGIGVARYLATHGADVRVTDMQSAERLADALELLRDLPITYRLGEHVAEDFEWAEIVVRNPGVPRESPWLEVARQAGAQIEMEMTLFFRACPAPIVGVTGTKGKTTTSTMIAVLLRQRWPETLLAGNMGRSAISEVDRLSEDVPVVIELSSFQLEGLDEQQLGPDVAVLTNIRPDHLDRYRSFEEYAETKLSIAQHLEPDGWMIINRDDPVTQQHQLETQARVASVGFEATPDDLALWVEEGNIVGRWLGADVDLGPLDALSLPGASARRNLLAACAAALSVGVEPEAIRAGIATIQPVPDRQEPVAEFAGLLYVNDTTATIPEASIEALKTYAGRPLTVIAGGSDKGLALDQLASALVTHATTVLLLEGTASERLATALRDRGVEPVGIYTSMQSAVDRATELTPKGGVVLLSPGCASFGLFRNEFDRGEQFRQAVAKRIASTSGEDGQR